MQTSERNWVGMDKGSIDAEAAAQGEALLRQFQSVGRRTSASGAMGKKLGSERRARQSIVYSARNVERFVR